MTMSPNLYHVVEYFIIAEFFIVLFLVIATYLTRAYYFYRSYMKKIRISKINAELNNIQATQTIKKLPYLRHIHLVIAALVNWDKHHQSTIEWNQNKIILMKEQILPQAVKFITSKDWSKRFLLLQCFDYYIDKTYEESFIRLIYDQSPIVSIETPAIALRFAKKPVIVALVDKIYKAHPKFQKLYLVQLTPNPILYDVVEEQLLSSTDPEMRHLCYRILKQIDITERFYKLAINDIKSPNLELKLSAIRSLIGADPNAISTAIIPLLSDKNWLVRNAAIQTLAKFNKEEVIKYLAQALSDEVWWVRVNAAKMLANFGDEGRALLEISSKNQELAAFNEPEYFLKIRNLREA